MKVRLNIATSPLVSNRRFVVGASVIGSLGLLALLLLSRQAYTMWSGDKAFRTRQAALQERQIAALQQQRQSLAATISSSQTL